jgi:two-component system LytT family response regulator
MRPLRAFLVDDEQLALRRLARLLEQTGRVEIAGRSSDPVDAIAQLRVLPVDVLFLDIQMPGMSGFEMLSQLRDEPLVIFTTAYHQYALQAFEVNSIGYLLKPVETQQLERALNKLDRIRGGSEPRPELGALLQQISSVLQTRAPAYPDRLASRLGERVEFIELERVTHIFARDKLTYASTPAKDYCLDLTISELEAKLDPKKFVRIHRSTIVNASYVHELYSWFAGRMLLRLKDEKKTELTVARDRVKALKEHLGI